MARKPFVVLDAEILSSSVWAESASVRLVWITLLILCDTEGYVGASLPGIARAAGVTLDEAMEAMERLQQPDEHSRTKTNEGRRLQIADRGWRVLNFLEHLDRLSSERTRARERMRMHRKRQSDKKSDETSGTNGDVTVRTGNREKGIGNREQGQIQQTDRTAQANPLISGRRPDFEKEAYRLIREINALEPDRDPTEILLEAAKWEGKDGRARSKVRLEAMSDDHLIRTVHDLRSNLTGLLQEKAKMAKVASIGT